MGKGSSKGAGPSISGDTADLEGVGLGSFLEYALGGNPRVPDATAIRPGLTMAAGGVSFSFRQRSNHAALGLSYTPQSSSSLLEDSWTTETSPPQIEPDGDGFEILSIPIPTGSTDPERKFFRLKVQAN